MRPRGYPSSGRLEDDLDYFHAYASYGPFGLLPQLLHDSGVIDDHGARRMAEVIGRTIRAEMSAAAMRPQVAAKPQRRWFRRGA